MKFVKIIIQLYEISINIVYKIIRRDVGAFGRMKIQKHTKNFVKQKTLQNYFYFLIYNQAHDKNFTPNSILIRFGF